jgi:3-deoxy-D-manno-octulosonic acid (KDO) 8-phosphate synthase
MMNCPITANVIFDMAHSLQRTNGRRISSERKESRGSSQRWRDGERPGRSG